MDNTPDHQIVTYKIPELQVQKGKTMRNRVNANSSTIKTVLAATGLMVMSSIYFGSLAASPEHCARVSKIVSKQLATNKNKSCGFAGPLWDGGADAQYHRCLALDLKRVNMEMVARKKLLSRCR